MLTALFKKQWLESIAFFFYGKDGKRRSQKSLIGFSLLMLYALGAVCFIFYEMGKLLCEPLVAQGLTWLYFAFMGTVATAFGVIGGIFTAKAKLYEAKDNDLLFAMPIPAWKVLFARMVGLYVFTFFFVAIVFVPAIVCYFVAVGFSLPVLFGCLLVLPLMPCLALAICTLLGWLLAFVSAKLPNKNLLTTILSLAFLVAYIALYSKLNEYVTYVIANGGKVASKMKTLLYPFAKLGFACTGDILAWLLYALIFVGAFALVYVLISLTYLRLVTSNRGGKRTKYRSKDRKQSSVFSALFKKECKRYTNNPMIALNCFLGTLFYLILPFLCIFMKDLRVLADVKEIREEIAMILAVILCTTATMNALSASSVSLEGENLWIVRSLPVATERLLYVKLAVHFLFTAIPSVVSIVALCIFMKVPVGYSVAIFLSVWAFILLTAILGQVFNLKMPNLHWTNELVAVKQNGAVVCSMFTDWGLLIALVGGYFLFGKYLFAGGYFLVCISLMLIASGLLIWWLKKRGTKILESL